MPGVKMNKPGVDYNHVAPKYDRRYTINDYRGIEKTLLEFTAGTQGSMLEVGCGTGHWLEILSHHTAFTLGLDPSAGMLRQASKAGLTDRLIQGRAENLPFADCTFSRVFCLNSFHHFTDPLSFIQDAFRVLEPGGCILILQLDPHTGLDRWAIYDYFPSVMAIDLQRYWPTAAIRQKLQDQGFTSGRTFEAHHNPVRLEARFALSQGRLDRSVTSQLLLISQLEYDSGIAAIQKDISKSASEGKELELISDLRLFATTAQKPS
jgi:SAM-dependent methyltransferase